MTTYNSDGQPTHNNKINVSSAGGIAVYADSLPVPVADANGRSGWYYAKTAGAEKFNYYLYAQGNRALRLKDVKEYYFVGSVDTYVDSASTPFIVIYTKPLGAGDGGAWYRTKITYSLNVNSAMVQLGVRSQFSTLASTNTRFPYSQNHLSVVGVVGPNDQTEEILTMSIHSDSAADNTTKILISNFGYCLHNRQEDVNIKLVA